MLGSLTWHADPPREVTEEDVDSIDRGWAVELVERWRGEFVGDKLVRAGEESLSALCTCALPAIYDQLLYPLVEESAASTRGAHLLSCSALPTCHSLCSMQ